MKAGATHIPLDPEYPSDRIQYILEDAGDQALVTATSFTINGLQNRQSGVHRHY
ncbi:MAG: AMP-binding protein [Cuspidothrix sp.]